MNKLRACCGLRPLWTLINLGRLLPACLWWMQAKKASENKPYPFFTRLCSIQFIKALQRERQSGMVAVIISHSKYFPLRAVRRQSLIWYVSFWILMCRPINNEYAVFTYTYAVETFHRHEFMSFSWRLNNRWWAVYLKVSFWWVLVGMHMSDLHWIMNGELFLDCKSCTFSCHYSMTDNSVTKTHTQTKCVTRPVIWR